MTSLKTKVDDLEVDKLKTVPINFKNVSNIADKHVVKTQKPRH